jgi:hypothetical protein
MLTSREHVTEPHAPDLESGGSFAAGGLQVRRGVVRDSTLDLLQQYCRIKRAAIKPLFADNLCPTAYSVYADLMSESLSSTLRPEIEAVCGTSLIPTFSYLRVYQRGSCFTRHIDRTACEISCSLSVEYQGDVPWPLMFEIDGRVAAVELAAGDMVVYRGSALPHWREACTGEYSAQLILNYVARDGDFVEWAYDKRPGLGYPIGREVLTTPKTPHLTRTPQP